MKNKFTIIALITFIFIIVSALIIFYFPKKLTAQEQCFKDNISKDCENMKIWDCHENHCHKMCNEINKEDCVNKNCIINNKNKQNKQYCLDHLH